MAELVKKGQAKVAKAQNVSKAVGAVADSILNAKPVVDVFMSIPHAAPAALPWAGLCGGLQVRNQFIFGLMSANIRQILSNPAKATTFNLVGMTHVFIRMNWYCALTEHLLGTNNTATADRLFKPVLQQLEQRVLTLYKVILLYQMKSVCSYYKHQGLVFLRGLTSLDNWDDDLGSVKTAEKELLDDWERYDRARASMISDKLVELTQNMEKQLGDIHQDLQDFIGQQQKLQEDSENKNCLRDLRVVNPQDDMKRIEDEKEELFDEAYKWILKDDKHAAFSNWDDSGLPPCRLLWIKGHAGTGKTMLLIGIIREFSCQLAVLAPSLAYFFCQGQGKTDPPLNNATAVLRSLTWMLLIQQPNLISYLKADYGFSCGALFTDTNAFVALSRLFKNMMEDARPVYFIVDALDECDKGLENLINLISTSLTLSDKVRWLVSSRPEVEIPPKLKNPDISRTLDLNAQGLELPIKEYIRYKLSTLKDQKGYTALVLAEVSDEVRRRSEDTFLWVALVFKKLEKVHGLNAVKIIKERPPGLSDLYDHMMTRIEKVEMIDPQDCKNVLVAISLAYRPLTFFELAILASLAPEIIPTAVEECGSFLTTKDDTVHPIHQLAKDYLTKNHMTRLQPRGIAQGHADIARRSIDAMSTLKRDIYDLRQYGFQSKDITPPEKDPLAPLRYLCVFWLDHLREAIKNNLETSTLCNLGHDFLKMHFLHWLESLSLLHKLPDGIISLRKLLNNIQVCT